MADDTTNSGPQNCSRINLSEDYKVRYWTGKLGVSKFQLEEVVRKVGPSSKAVEEALRKQALSEAALRKVPGKRPHRRLPGSSRECVRERAP